MKCLCFLLLMTTVFVASENPDENLGVDENDLFEGDMILPADVLYRAEHGMDVDSSRKRGSVRSSLWPSGEVPYVIDNSLARGRARAAINAGMNEWTKKTCIRFKKRTNERAYVNFASGSAGCWSYVGRTGNSQVINLGSAGCWTQGIVAHEIGHAIGFFHEQSRPDRDQFVIVQLQNVIPGRESNFNKYPRSRIDSLGTPYDYESVMHYSGTAFSRNGRRTIVTKDSRRFVKTDGGLASGGQNASAGITRSRETARNDVTNAISQE
ncbi:zinc metalloproteinase nas-14-like [Pocillopora verrucosa]|uniref:zinc metalloproteinase nas-14-like n=1 Tax=Pocillopora verrucosa TaxID=203993 RepID=UPI00333EFE4B